MDEEYTIDSLNIEVNTDTREFEKGIGHIERVLKKMSGFKIDTSFLDKFKSKFKSVKSEISKGVETEGLSDYMKYLESNDYISFDKWKGLGESIDEATQKASSFRNVFKGVGGLLRSGLRKPLDRIKLSLKDMNRQLGYFKSVLRNVLTFSAFYNIMRAINEAFKTGTDNLYQYSKILGGRFAQSMDALATTLQYFQNSIGALTAPIINLFTPAIEAATDKIVEMINAVTQMIASLSGASSWSKAVKAPKEYAEAADHASKANKNLLAGFDELNVIQSKSSGSSSNTPDYGAMFTEVSLEGYQLPDFVQRIKDSILSGDWAGAAQILAKKINSVFASVPWGNIGTVIGNGLQSVVDSYNSFMRNLNFEGIGSGIAQALNNLMERFDFTTLGQAFAQKFNAAFDMAYTFVTEFDWSEFGVSISNAINGFFAEIDWERIGKTISETVGGLLVSLKDAIANTDWRTIGVSLTTAVNQIQWSEVFLKGIEVLSEAFKGLVELITGIVQGLDWAHLSTELWKILNETVSHIDFAGIIGTAFELLGSLVGSIAGLAAGWFTSAWESVKQGWNSVKGYFDERIKEAGGDVFLGFLLGIEDAIIGIGTWIKDHIFTPFINGIKSVFGIASPSKEMAVIGGYIVDGLLEGLKNTWSNVTAWVSETFNNIKTTILNVFNSLKTGVSNVWSGMWNSIRGFANSILGGVEKMVNGVIRGFNNMINAMNRLSFDVPDWVPVIGGNKFGFNIKTLNEVSIPRLADGGFVSSGQLFMARENGMTEYVGSMGNRAAVANNDQIVSGIASGVAAANSEQNRLLSEQNALLRAILEKETDVRITPSAGLGKVMNQSVKLYAAAAGGR